MAVLPLAAIPFIMHVLLWLWVFIALALILIVLIQKGKGGGIGAAFGGAMANSLLGTKTGDWLTKVTIGMVVAFLVIAVFLNKFYRPTVSSELGGAVTTTSADTSDTAETNTATDGSRLPGTDGNTDMPGGNDGTNAPVEASPAADGAADTGAGQGDGQ